MAIKTRGRCSASRPASTRRSSRASAARLAQHQLSGAAEQGHRRRQRLRPRGGHPPGRHAQERRDLRDHAARADVGATDHARARQALGPRGLLQAPHRAGLPARGRRACSRVFAEFKKLADRKKSVLDADLIALASDERAACAELWALDSLQVMCGTTGLPTASVRLRDPGRQGPQCRRTRHRPGRRHLQGHRRDRERAGRTAGLRRHAVTEGIDALGEVTVRVAGGADRPVHGHGADTDIVVAAPRRTSRRSTTCWRARRRPWVIRRGTCLASRVGDPPGRARRRPTRTTTCRAPPTATWVWRQPLAR
jgi:hypothetical protein